MAIAFESGTVAHEEVARLSVSGSMVTLRIADVDLVYSARSIAHAEEVRLAITRGLAELMHVPMEVTPYG